MNEKLGQMSALPYWFALKVRKKYSLAITITHITYKNSVLTSKFSWMNFKDIESTQKQNLITNKVKIFNKAYRNHQQLVYPFIVWMSYVIFGDWIKKKKIYEHKTDFKYCMPYFRSTWVQSCTRVSYMHHNSHERPIAVVELRGVFQNASYSYAGLE